MEETAKNGFQKKSISCAKGRAEAMIQRVLASKDLVACLLSAATVPLCLGASFNALAIEIPRLTRHGQRQYVRSEVHTKGRLVTYSASGECVVSGPVNLWCYGALRKWSSARSG